MTAKEKKETAASKKIKSPKIFSKPVSKKKWEKKYIGKIYLPDDRKFLESLTVVDDDTVRIKTAGLSKKDLTRLKNLEKTIKRNRKRINFLLPLALVIIAGGVLYFQFYMKNELVKNLIETQLEQVFEAQVDIGKADLQISRGALSLENLVIADSRNPMQNLIEFNALDASLDPEALLQKRVFIDELGFMGMKTGTPRTESGFLPKDVNSPADGDAPPPADGSAPPPEDSGSGDSENQDESVINRIVNQMKALTGEIDPEEIFEQQKENFKSFEVIDHSRETVEEYAEYWETRVGEWENKYGEWEDSARYIRSVDAGSFSTLGSAQSTINKLQGIYEAGERDYAEIKADYSSAEMQYEEIPGMAGEIKDAVSADYEYIKSLVTLPAADKIDWASSVIEEELSMPIKKYLDRLETGLKWYGKYREINREKNESDPAAGREGRSLPPAEGTPPVFVLAHAFASGEEDGVKYKVDLVNLTSNPAVWEENITLDLELETENTGFMKAVFSEDHLNFTLPAAPFDLGDSLEGLDIKDLSGKLSIETAMKWDDSGFSGSLNLGTGDLAVMAVDEDSLVFKLINTTLEAVKPLGGSGDFTWSETEGMGITLETEMDEKLGDAAMELLKEAAGEGLKLLENYLGEELDGPLGDFDSISAEFEKYVEDMESYRDGIDGYREMAEDKIDEIRKSVEENLADQARELLPDEVNDQVDDAADKLKEGLSKFGF